MPRAPLPENEQLRLRTLARCRVLDTAPEPAFDAITRMAARLCDMPMALISLVDEHRQWFKSQVGIVAAETPRDQAFCAYAILSDDAFVIPDATLDARVADSSLVTEEPGLRFYAGIPLRMKDGAALGTLCVLDTQPRTYTAEMDRHLQDLAMQAAELLELRLRTYLLEDELDEVRLILDTVPSFIYYKDGNNKILNVNRAAADAMEMSVAEITGRQTEELFPAEASAQYLRDDREVIREGKPRLGIEEDHQGGEGSRRLIRTDKIPLKNADGDDRIIAVATDITDLRSAEDALSRSRQLLDSISDNSPSMIYAKDLDGRFLTVNRRFGELVGQDPAAIIGQRHHDVFPADVADALHANDLAVIEARAPRRFEEEMPHGEGTRRYVSVKFPLFDGSGSLHGVGSISTDITDILALQHELEDKNTELERFVYTASHDLKSPLVTILGYTGHLLLDLEEGRSEDLTDYAGRIRGAAERMRANVDDLLELSRVGRMTANPQRIELAPFVRQVWESVRSAAHHSGMLETSFEVSEVYMDRTHATQLIENLLENAVKYGHVDGAPDTVEIGSQANADGSVTLFVRDHGPGIAPGHRDRVFGLFERLSNQTNGTGVGLAIVRRVVEINGGRIWIEETPGGGATFRAALPRPAAHELASRAGVAA